MLWVVENLIERSLLDYATSQGLELTEARAARAVAAGRGAELRRRLEHTGGTAERT